MKKIFLVSFSLFFLNSCFSSSDEKIEFSSEVKKVEFCSTNLDNTNCSFYRPLFVKFYTMIEDRTSKTLIDVVTRSNAMTVYRFTSDYEKEIMNIYSIVQSNPSDYRFLAFKIYIKG